ncbi:MAG: metallophosphoesterase [Candidatus Binatia bacterium]
MYGNLAAALQRLWAHVVRTFFANFFRLLLLAVSISQWVVLARLSRTIGSLPLAAQITGPLLIFGINRRLAKRTRQQRRDHGPVGGMPRLYYAVAFTCLFCVLFLLLTDAMWMSAKILLGAIAVEARTTHHAGLRIDSELGSAFHWLANAGMMAIGVAFAYGYTVGQLRLRVRRFTLPLRHYPPSWNGLRIAQISDIHIGQNIDRAQLEGFVARVNSLEPDLICITGDIADSPTADLDSFLPVLARLHATYGVFAILGNHDHYAGADHVEAALRQLTPFTVLRDQKTTIEVKGRLLHVVGLDDHGRDWARGKTTVPRLDAVLATVPADEPVLLLSHRPDVFPQAAARGVALTLAGHTHGGQIGVPWFDGRIRNLAEFITDFDRGLYERTASYLYVNCGLGVTGQRIRLNTPREILIIEVHSAAAALAA